METSTLALGTTDLYATLAGHLKRRSTLILLGLGFLTAVLHATFRFPLHLPGHHGLEWMALLILARRISPYRWAASVAAAAAAAGSLLPQLGFHDPLTPVIYLLPGLVVDLLYMAAPQAKRQSVLFLSTVAALAFATKPLIQWLSVQSLGLPADRWSSGLAYLLLMHLLFAFAGGAIGALLWQRSASR